MKIFLSSIEQPRGVKIVDGKRIYQPMIDVLLEKGIKPKYSLMSYFYLRKDIPNAEKVRDNSEEVMIDSGAHSFQKGQTVNWDEYTKQYADFIKEFDRPNIVGFFEMDVDNIIGYEKVLELRKVLKQASDKIIPVWHKNRGVDGFKEMVHEYAGKVIAITGFKNEDIQDHQYLMFLKYAKQHGCKVHCLGMTRKKILDKVPFDYTDSSSWAHQSIYGHMVGKGAKVSREYSKDNMRDVFFNNYVEGMKMQDYYEFYWKKKNTVI